MGTHHAATDDTAEALLLHKSSAYASPQAAALVRELLLSLEITNVP